MRCVFLDSQDKCFAEIRGIGDFWKVDEETKNIYCIKHKFVDCPRYNAKMAVLTKGR